MSAPEVDRVGEPADEERSEAGRDDDELTIEEVSIDGMCGVY
ncbi:MAG: mycofactocin precursor MftA [Acidimicrobiales bacterium]